MTTEELAARCSYFAQDPDYLRPSTLSNLFAGKRKTISVTEVIIFALALRISPIALLVSVGVEDDNVEFWSGNVVSSAAAFDLFVWPPGAAESLEVDDPTQARVVALTQHFAVWRDTVTLLPRIGARLHALPSLATATPESTALVDAARAQIRELQASRSRLWGFELAPTPLPDAYEWIDGFDDISDVSEVNLKALLLFSSEQYESSDGAS
jgi:hypothetical protein